MKSLVVPIFIFAITSIGCSHSQARYGANAESPASQSPQAQSSQSTNSTIRFGQILQSYLGKPYAGHSRFEPGLDCSLFTGEVFKKYAKIQLPRTSEDQFKAGSPVKNGLLAFGDLVFFNTDGNNISHVGVYVGHDEFIHATNSNGVIISNMGEKYWAKRFMGASRVIK